MLTTSERLEEFRDIGIFSSKASINPELADWSDKHSKVILSLDHALRPFPRKPESVVLKFEKNKSYPRDALLETLVRYGYERDELPGFSVRGDTVTIFLDAEDTTKALKLEFFANDLETLALQEKPIEHFTVAPLKDLEDEDPWDTKLLEHLQGTIFLDAPELYAGDTDEALHDVRLPWLWEHLKQQEIISFGRDRLRARNAQISF